MKIGRTDVVRSRPRMLVAIGSIALTLTAASGYWLSTQTGASSGLAGGIVMPQSSQEPTGWSVDYPISLPNGYLQTSGLASSSDGSSVWALSQGLDSNHQPIETLFDWTNEGGLTSSFSINTSDHSLDAGMITPIAVGLDGRAWVGINQNLLVADPKTNTLKSVPLPPVTVGSPGSGLLQLPSTSWLNFDPIEALAVQANGEIAVARMYATSLDLVNPSNLVVTQAQLPPNSSLIGIGQGDVASASDGGPVAAVLYASSGAHELGIFSDSNWSTQTPSCDLNQLEYSGDVLVGSGLGCQVLITNSQSASTGGASELVIPNIAAQQFGYLGGKMLSFNPEQSLTTYSGPSVVNLTLGQGQYGAPLGGNGSSSSIANKLVPIMPVLSTIPVGGTEWFVPSVGGGSLIGRIVSGA